MIPNVQNVFDAARSTLGDDQIPGGEVFTNSLLAPHLAVSYAELFRALVNVQSALIQREAYWNVPINTGVVVPATMGIANMEIPLLVEERGSVTAWAVSNAVPGAGLVTITTAPNTLAAGDQPVIYGIQGLTDDINDVWACTPSSPTVFTANGATATGTYTSGGVVSISAEQFQEVFARDRLTVQAQAPGQSFGIYAWEFGKFRFPPCSVVRQIRVTYKLSGNAPTATTASVGIDDSLTFLNYRTAGLAARSKGMRDRAAAMTLTAVGPNWESGGFAGGILGQMLDAQVRELQNLDTDQRRSPGYGGNTAWRSRSDLIV